MQRQYSPEQTKDPDEPVVFCPSCRHWKSSTDFGVRQVGEHLRLRGWCTPCESKSVANLRQRRIAAGLTQRGTVPLPKRKATT